MATNSASASTKHESEKMQELGAVQSHPKAADLLDLQGAAKASDTEHRMSLREGIKLYPKAIAWSVLLSMCVVMEGFDLVLINSLYSLPAFRSTFGAPTRDGSYEISAAWQSGLSNGAQIGQILGLSLSGIMSERYGYKKTLIASLFLTTGFIFIVFFAQSLPVLLVGEFLMGIPWGVFQTLTTTYAAEVCPIALRAYLTTYVNLCWVIGQFLASAVLKGTSDRTDQWAYKIPFACQWIWPVPLIIGIAMAPESPWWLVRKGRIDDAKTQLIRLSSAKQDGFDPADTVAMIVYTTELETAQVAGASYKDCFKGSNLRRTEIACMVWSLQLVCGSSLISYSTYFYQSAGLDTSNSFSMSLGLYGIGAVGTILSWPLMSKWGRRTLYIFGQSVMFIILLIIGFLGLASKSNTAAQWAIGSVLLVLGFSYDATIGPVCYSLVAELPSTRLRNKTVVFARCVYNVVNIVTNLLTPRMLNATAWNWGAKAGFFWAGICFLCLTWTYFRLPEPKGRTFAELDMLFEQEVPARLFKSTSVDPFVENSAYRHTTASQKGTDI